MIFVIGLWTFLRAMLVGSAAVAIENLVTSPTIPRQSGQPSSSSRRSRMIRLPSICFGIEMGSTGKPSRDASRAWGSTRF